MTQRQMDEAKMSLPSRMEYRNWTDEQKRLDEELSCRSMINSCLCYGGISGFWAESKWRFGPDKSYAAPHVRKLGLDRVKELVAEQEADFSKARVIHNSYTDSEGCTYNSIVWADE